MIPENVRTSIRTAVVGMVDVPTDQSPYFADAVMDVVERAIWNDMAPGLRKANLRDFGPDGLGSAEVEAALISGLVWGLIRGIYDHGPLLAEVEERIAARMREARE